MNDNKDMFEKNLKELETIVKKLEEGNIPLDEMLSLFERGIKLTKACTSQLDEAEQKINILVKNENGEMTEEEFSNISEIKE